VSDDIREQGMTTRREVLGEEQVDRTMARADSFTADFQVYITRSAWGAVGMVPPVDAM